MIETEDTPGQAAIVIGSSGGIGRAVMQAMQHSTVYAVSRSAATGTLSANVKWHVCADDPAARDDTAQQIAADLAASGAALTRVVVCSGTLHGDDYRPERALRELNADAMHTVYHVNAVVPLLWLAALEPALRKSPGCVAAFLSARVGSITDNHLGGWYSYRGAKAALNMMLKSAAVELARRAPAVKLLAFHPGTTDTPLSEPFQSRVPQDKLFAPDYVAQRLLAVMQACPQDNTLSFVDWAGEDIQW